MLVCELFVDGTHFRSIAQRGKVTKQQDCLRQQDEQRHVFNIAQLKWRHILLVCVGKLSLLVFAWLPSNFSLTWRLVSLNPHQQVEEWLPGLKGQWSWDCLGRVLVSQGDGGNTLELNRAELLWLFLEPPIYILHSGRVVLNKILWCELYFS